MPDGTCSVDGCEKDRLARGYCGTHYARWRKHGDPHTVLPTGLPRRTAEEKERTQRAWRLMRTYGITQGEYDALVVQQDGRCALCDEVPERRRLTNNGKPWIGLVVDHDHETGAVRGLLCMGCNVALGRVEKVGLDRVEAYLGG